MRAVVRVVVIGGGVIGCAIAERLCRAGHQVTLCERDRVGAHASGAAAGLLAPYSEAQGEGEFLRLAVRSFNLFPELAARLRQEVGIDVELRADQSLALAFTEAEVGALRARLSGGPAADARLVEGEECRRLEPGLAPEVQAAFLLSQSQVTPPRLVRALAWSAARRGAVIREGEPVIGILTRGGLVEGVRLAQESLAADWVVIAAGPWSKSVGLMAAVELDVVPRRGQLVSLSTAAPVLGRILTWGHYYLVPKPDGSLIAGSTEEEVGFEARPTATGAGLLLDFARRAVPGLAGAVVERLWAALRPARPGDVPLIGPVGAYPNLVVAAGHHRNGILLAPVTAEVVASGMDGGWEP